MWEDTQRAQFLGAGAKFKEWFSREEGRQRTKHSTATRASQGDTGVPSARCGSTAIQLRATGLLPGCMEMDLGPSGPKVCSTVFKGASGRAEASMGVTGGGGSGRC